jgi:hypothetical protein
MRTAFALTSSIAILSFGVVFPLFAVDNTSTQLVQSEETSDTSPYPGSNRRDGLS